MSANIPIGKLKVSVFGRGYDDDRGNSGTGTVDEVITMKAYSAAIDSTGAYAWIVTDSGLKKYRMSDWTVVETDIPSGIAVFHPCNVSNNYGLVLYPNEEDSTYLDAYIFDLTNDTLIAHIETTIVTSGSGGLIDWECVLISGKIYLINRHWGSNTNDKLLTFDIENEIYDDSIVIGGVGCNGFINNSLIYAIYTRPWFSDTTTAYAFNFSGSAVWSNTGIDSNANISPWGFTGNGYLYLPVLSDGKWHWGVFNGTSNPTFRPVSPIRMFGEYDSTPSLAPYISGNNRNIYMSYTDGKTKGCALTSLGVIYTDFTDAVIIADKTIAPIAMNDDVVLCSDYANNKLYVIGL